MQVRHLIKEPLIENLWRYAFGCVIILIGWVYRICTAASTECTSNNRKKRQSVSRLGLPRTRCAATRAPVPYITTYHHQQIPVTTNKAHSNPYIIVGYQYNNAQPLFRDFCSYCNTRCYNNCTCIICTSLACIMLYKSLLV